MVKIAIVDDNKIICNELKSMIEKFDMQYNYDIGCDIYNNCEEFIARMATENYQLIFLDIEFPDMSGIELGDRIRNSIKNLKVQIVFISSRSTYAMELFELQPFNFLLKPLDNDKVNGCLSKFFSYYYETNRVFEYNYENIKNHIPINEIVYFESMGRKIIMHTLNKQIEFYGVFADIADKLSQQFIVVRRGILVNMQYIVNSNFSSIEIVGNIVFQITRSNRENVRNRLCGM